MLFIAEKSNKCIYLSGELGELHDNIYGKMINLSFLSIN